MAKSLKRESKFYLGLVVTLLVAVGSWAIFRLTQLALSTFLENRFGITNEVTQLSILIGLVFVVLLVVGYSFRKAIKKII